MRRLPLLLLLYVTLDFANPLMPGAVRFEAGSVEFVQADRTARAVAAVAPAPATRGIEDGLPRPRALRGQVPGSPEPRPVQCLVRVLRVASPQSDPSPSPAEDH